MRLCESAEHAALHVTAVWTLDIIVHAPHGSERRVASSRGDWDPNVSRSSSFEADYRSVESGGDECHLQSQRPADTLDTADALTYLEGACS